jgi:hypothetical protein
MSKYDGKYYYFLIVTILLKTRIAYVNEYMYNLLKTSIYQR